jgi:hypothetical protein
VAALVAVGDVVSTKRFEISDDVVASVDEAAVFVDEAPALGVSRSVVVSAMANPSFESG